MATPCSPPAVPPSRASRCHDLPPQVRVQGWAQAGGGPRRVQHKPQGPRVLGLGRVHGRLHGLPVAAGGGAGGLAAGQPPRPLLGGCRLVQSARHRSLLPSQAVRTMTSQMRGATREEARHTFAAQVYGIDVAYGQVANRVRQDERLTLIERFNVRYLTPEDVPAKVGGVGWQHGAGVEALVQRCCTR